MTINYQLTEQEVVRGLLQHRRQPYRYLWGQIGIGIFGVLLVCFGSQLQQVPAITSFVSGCTFIGISVALLIISSFTVRRAYRRVVRNNPVFTDPKEVSFDDRGLIFRSQHRRSEVAWAAFVRLSQDERYIYLHSDHNGNVTMLPKRAFDDTSMQEFLSCTHFAPQL